jgi:hypothetical protein
MDAILATTLVSGVPEETTEAVPLVPRMLLGRPDHHPATDRRSIKRVRLKER